MFTHRNRLTLDFPLDDMSWDPSHVSISSSGLGCRLSTSHPLACSFKRQVPSLHPKLLNQTWGERQSAFYKYLQVMLLYTKIWELQEYIYFVFGGGGRYTLINQVLLMDSCFHLFIFINSAAVNIFIHTSLSARASVSGGVGTEYSCPLIRTHVSISFPVEVLLSLIRALRQLSKKR